MSGPPGYQRGDRIALEYTTDPHTRLRPGDEGTVTGYDPGLGQFSNRRAHSCLCDLRFASRTCPRRWLCESAGLALA